MKCSMIHKHDARKYFWRLSKLFILLQRILLVFKQEKNHVFSQILLRNLLGREDGVSCCSVWLNFSRMWSTPGVESYVDIGLRSPCFDSLVLTVQSTEKRVDLGSLLCFSPRLSFLFTLIFLGIKKTTSFKTAVFEVFVALIPATTGPFGPVWNDNLLLSWSTISR